MKKIAFRKIKKLCLIGLDLDSASSKVNSSRKIKMFKSVYPMHIIVTVIFFFISKFAQVLVKNFLQCKMRLVTWIYLKVFKFRDSFQFTFSLNGENSLQKCS